MRKHLQTALAAVTALALLALWLSLPSFADEAKEALLWNCRIGNPCLPLFAVKLADFTIGMIMAGAIAWTIWLHWGRRTTRQWMIIGFVVVITTFTVRVAIYHFAPYPQEARWRSGEQYRPGVPLWNPAV